MPAICVGICICISVCQRNGSCVGKHVHSAGRGATNGACNENHSKNAHPRSWPVSFFWSMVLKKSLPRGMPLLLIPNQRIHPPGHDFWARFELRMIYYYIWRAHGACHVHITERHVIISSLHCNVKRCYLIVVAAGGQIKCTHIWKDSGLFDHPPWSI